MGKKDLRYFMRSNETEIVTVPGPESFKDEEGNVINFEIKVLSQKEIEEINDKYRTRSFATDKKGNPIVANGEIVWKTIRDSSRAARHLLVESLQYPNLADEQLMKHYGCVDVTEMPRLVFSKADEYNYVSKIVLTALGLRDDDNDNDNSDLENAKN